MTGFNSKRDAAANKLQDEADMLTIAYLDGYEKGKKAVLAQPAQEPVCDKDPQGCWNVRCQLGKQCKNLAQPAQEQALLDAIVGGTGVMLGDKRIDPASIYKQPAQEPHEYDWSMLEAAKESLREHMARIKELEAALKQALEALETSTDWNVSATGRQLKSMQAITALRTRLAQPPLPVQPKVFTTGHCQEKAKPGGCRLHNIHCGFPDCDRKKS